MATGSSVRGGRFSCDWGTETRPWRRRRTPPRSRRSRSRRRKRKMPSRPLCRSRDHLRLRLLRIGCAAVRARRRRSGDPALAAVRQRHRMTSCLTGICARSPRRSCGFSILTHIFGGRLTGVPDEHHVSPALRAAQHSPVREMASYHRRAGLCFDMSAVDAAT